MLYRVIRQLLIIVLRTLFCFKVRGIENIPKKGGFILASNHASLLDPMVLGAASFRKLDFMAKHELFYNPLFSRFISSVGAFAVKRDSADLSALRDAMRRIRDGRAIALFPEGSRRVNGIIDAPQAGIGFLAAKLNVPVIPAFIKGTEKALPAGAKLIRPAKISVHFGRQISIERRMPYQDIARQIMVSIRHLSW